MPTFQFKSSADKRGAVVSLTEKPFLRSGRPVPPEDWLKAAGDQAFSGIAQLMSLIERDDGSAVIDGDVIRISHDAVAGLTEPQAVSIGLPPAAPYALSIETQNLITDPTFKIHSIWVAPGNRPIQMTRDGAFVSRSGEQYRLSEPLFSIISSIETLNAEAAPDSERFRAIANLQDLLPNEAQQGIRLDDYIRRFRIFHATAFSLQLRPAQNSFEFDPILFGRRVQEKLRDGETTIVSEAEGLLSPQLQEVFARKRFSAESTVRDRYAVEGGVYMYIDPALQTALAVVRKMQDASPEERKRFARSPQLYLREALGDEGDDAALETLFIETEQYSERVVDIGVWAPPVLPWIKKVPTDWLPEKFGVQIGDRYISIAPVDLDTLRTKVETAMKAGETSISYEGEQLPANKRTLDALSSLIGILKPEAAVPPAPGKPPARTDCIKHVLIVDENFEQVDYTRKLTPRRINEAIGTPAAVRPALKAHQTQGLQWLQETWGKGFSGVLLADDMGLGKTLQALAFLSWLKINIGSRSRRALSLVVAPTGLLPNWIAEHDRHLFSPGLGQVCKAYGRHLQPLKTGSRDVEAGVPGLDIAALQSADWVLTTYETLRDYHMSFAAIPFDCVVFDEMQKVKNPASLNTRAAKSLNADFVLGMTGTPVENQLEDLWSILDIVNPGRLGDLKTFSSTFRPDDHVALEELRQLVLEASNDLPPPVLRRLKIDHLASLPEKRIHVRKRNMPQEQATAYEIAVAKAKAEDAGPGAMLAALHEMRGVSLHPVWPNTGNVADAEAYINKSARLIEAFAILDAIASADEKVLIFLESLDMQYQLSILIKDRYKLPRIPMQINGEVTGERRQKAVDVFQADRKGFDVMILSPKAGGVGLTLTAANHVIHLSRWWNPAVEDQCTDRIYRIGQDQTVNVYYPLAIHPAIGDTSFDILLHKLLEHKRDIGRRMLIPPVDLKRDEAWFAENLYGRTKSQGNKSSHSLDEIDHMEPKQFELWAINRMLANGYIAHSTPGSYDGGADGVFKHKETGARVIVQCKHKQNTDTSCDDAAIDDLLRARTAYNALQVELIALTNAQTFSGKAKKRARDHNIALVSRSQLTAWPTLN